MKQFLSKKILNHLPSEEGNVAFLNLAQKLSKGIVFKVRSVKDESGKYYIAESISTPGLNIITTGENIETLLENIKDATFTAFEVPHYYWRNNYLESQYRNNHKEIELKYASAT